MKFLRSTVALLLAPAISTSLAAEPDFSCGGNTTKLYSSKDVILTICHGPYTEVDHSKLNQWHSCDDATIQGWRKEGHMTEYADCSLLVFKEFSVRDGSLLLRHFFTDYPGFEQKPKVIETIDLRTNNRKFEFVGKFSASGREDFERAIMNIDSMLSKPFDGRASISSVYEGFFIIRDYAIVDQRSALSALQKYEKNGHPLIDGEVSETLHLVVDEVKLIDAARQVR